MHKFLVVICFMSCSTALLYQKLVPNNSTQHFELSEEDWKRVSTSNPVFSFKNPDTLITHQMHLLSDVSGEPLLYYADILTPVCIDGLCKPVYVELYWNLLGQYIGYGDYPDKVLTKYDHDKFEERDYLKLHNLLLDKSSVLGRRHLSQLYDKNTVRTDTIKFKGVEVDAISGATRKEIKQAIVEGGLYSCYTLWHLAHGSAKELILDNLAAIYSPTVSDYFLKSNHQEYQYHAIQEMDVDEFDSKLEHIVPFIKTGTPLMRSYVLKKMPKEMFNNPLVSEQLYKNMSSFDFNAKTLLLNNLSYSNESAAVYASAFLPSFSKNQLSLFLKAIQELDAVELVKENLLVYSKGGNHNYSFLVDDLLELYN